MKIFINDLVMEVIYESENRVLDRAIVPIEDLHSFAANWIEHKNVYGGEKCKKPNSRNLS